MKMSQTIKDLPVGIWNIIIHAYGIHGKGKEAINKFNEMLAEHINPDSATFVSLLSACSHSGLLHECEHYYGSIGREFGMVANIQHQNCVVDCLARAGYLAKAEDFVDRVIAHPSINLPK